MTDPPDRISKLTAEVTRLREELQTPEQRTRAETKALDDGIRARLAHRPNVLVVDAGGEPTSPESAAVDRLLRSAGGRNAA